MTDTVKAKEGAKVLGKTGKLCRQCKIRGGWGVGGKGTQDHNCKLTLPRGVVVQLPVPGTK